MTPSQLTIDHDRGGVAFWTSARVPRSVVRDAANAAGVLGLVPADPPPTTVLREQMRRVAETAFPRARREMFDVRRLEQPGAFECVRVTPGHDRNKYTPLYSAIIDRDWNVGLLSSTADVSWLRDAVAEGREFFTATDVSRICIRALERWHCTLLKEDGGVWFVPGAALDQYRAWAGGLQPHAKYHVTTFEIASDPDTVSHVLDSLGHEVIDGVQAITDDMLKAEGGMSDRSVKVREQRAQALLDKVKAYEGYTGAALTQLADAVQRVQQALAVSTLLAASV